MSELDDRHLENLKGGKAQAFRGSGDSMLPTFPPGTQFLVAPCTIEEDLDFDRLVACKGVGLLANAELRGDAYLDRRFVVGSVDLLHG